jgi:hypothetical protein
MSEDYYKYNLNELNTWKTENLFLLKKCIDLLISIHSGIKSPKSNKNWGALGVGRLIRGQKSVVPAPSDRDPAGETSHDRILQFSPSVFAKKKHSLNVGADLC